MRVALGCTSEDLQREFDAIAPEVARAIRALIIGFLPVELRSKPFDVTVTIDDSAVGKPKAKKRAVPRVAEAR